MRSVFTRFILSKARNVRFGSYMTFIGTFIGLVMAFETVYTKYLIGHHGREALAWAIVTAASLSLFGFLAISCALSQIKLSEELNRVNKVKDRLENRLLRNSKSYKPKSRK